MSGCSLLGCTITKAAAMMPNERVNGRRCSPETRRCQPRASSWQPVAWSAAHAGQTNGSSFAMIVISRQKLTYTTNCKPHHAVACSSNRLTHSQERASPHSLRYEHRVRRCRAVVGHIAFSYGIVVIGAGDHMVGASTRACRQHKRGSDWTGTCARTKRRHGAPRKVPLVVPLVARSKRVYDAPASLLQWFSTVSLTCRVPPRVGDAVRMLTEHSSRSAPATVIWAAVQSGALTSVVQMNAGAPAISGSGSEMVPGNISQAVVRRMYPCQKAFTWICSRGRLRPPPRIREMKVSPQPQRTSCKERGPHSIQLMV